MASTYSSNLKLQLMATGENSTTWGAVTNTNLGTALEEAIVGSADVTFSSADTSISLSNSNATQAARHLRLNLTGTTGGSTRTLTVPDIEKAYLVNNACADTVQVANSTGTNVAVPAGKTMWVYSTGSNVVDATTHLTSLTLSTALAPAQGGTGINAVGTSGNVLTSNGSVWVSQVPAPAKIVNYYHVKKATDSTSTSTTAFDLGMTVTAALTNASNKFLIFATTHVENRGTGDDAGSEFKIYIDGSEIVEATQGFFASNGSVQNAGIEGTLTIIYEHSPGDTDSVEMALYGNAIFGGTTHTFFANSSSITVLEVTV